MPTIAQNGIPAAPGYPQYSNTFVIPPIQSDRMLETFYGESIFTQITSRDALNEITGPGVTVYFLREPRLSLRPYVKDGLMTYDTFEADTVEFTLGTAKYFGIKIADHDKMAMTNWSRYLQIMTDSTARLFKMQLDCEIMAQIAADADCNNKGSQAGVSTHSYDLGTPGDPLVITPDNVGDVLADLQAVLDEQQLPAVGRFAVLPPKFKNVLLKSEFKQACLLNCNSTADGPMVDGEPPMRLYGFDLIFSNCTPSVLDATANVRAFYAIAGLPMATAFASWADMKSEMRDKDNPYETYISTVMSYGFAVMYPQALALAYITFSA